VVRAGEQHLADRQPLTLHDAVRHGQRVVLDVAHDRRLEELPVEPARQRRMREVAAVAVVLAQLHLVAVLLQLVIATAGMQLAELEQLLLGEEQSLRRGHHFGVARVLRILPLHGLDLEARDGVGHALVHHDLDVRAALRRIEREALHCDHRVEPAAVAVHVAHREHVRFERLLHERAAPPVEQARLGELPLGVGGQSVLPQAEAAVGHRVVAADLQALDAYLRSLADLEDHVGDGFLARGQRAGRGRQVLAAGARDHLHLAPVEALAPVALEQPLAHAVGLVHEQLGALVEQRPLAQRLLVDLDVADEARLAVGGHLGHREAQLASARHVAHFRVGVHLERAPQGLDPAVDEHGIERLADLLADGVEQLLLAVALHADDVDREHFRRGSRRRLRGRRTLQPLRRLLRRRRRRRLLRECMEHQCEHGTQPHRRLRRAHSHA
jgi:hypothetical protein